MNTWMSNESLERLMESLISVNWMRSVIRVRRRGFPREARRGYDVPWAGGIYRVVRRSNWNLWLEKRPDAGDRWPPAGETVRVKLPPRYATPRMPQ